MGDYGIFNILELIGSLGVFIYGMKIMSESIQKIAGKSLRMLMRKLTDNRFAGWLTGFIATALVQSSSATTVMVVSFVNAGILTVTQSIGVIMGANLGTTATSWLISILGLGSFKIAAFALPVIAIGFPLIFTSKKGNKALGEFLLGFGLLFLGLDFMKNAVPDLKGNPEVLHFLADFSNYGHWSILLFVLIGTILTVVVQSSSAAMSITLVMVAQGWVPIEVGASMVLGENIGTTITAYLASLIGNVNSKRAARVHMIFNLIGVFWMVILLVPFLGMIDRLNMYLFDYGSVYIAEGRGEAMPKALSLFHSIFNLLNALLLIGFVPQLEKIVTKLIPEKEDKNGLKVLGKHMIVETPELAIMEAKAELLRMGKTTQEMTINLRAMLSAEPKEMEALITKIQEGEDITDKMEVGISEFLIEVAQQGATGETSVHIIKMVEASDELETVGDICFQAGIILEKKAESELVFGNKMTKGINEMFDALDESFKVMQRNLDAEFDEVDLESAKRAELNLNEIKKTLKAQNMKRMETKEEKLQSSLAYRDLYNSLAKIGDKVFSVSKALAQAN